MKNKKSVCRFCGDKIKTMIFRGSGFCCVDCQKGRPKGTVNGG